MYAIVIHFIGTNQSVANKDTINVAKIKGQQDGLKFICDNKKGCLH